MSELRVVVDSRIRIEALDDRVLRADVCAAFEHDNPDYHKKRGLGLWVGSTPKKVRTWELVEPRGLSLPRGGMRRLREIAARRGFAVRSEDRRVSLEAVDFPPFAPDPDDPSAALAAHQRLAIETARRREQGIIRAPTSAGKTHIALALAAEIRQPALVVMRDQKLLDQWLEKAERHLGIPAREIGVIGGGKKTVGRRLTLALQQTLYSQREKLIPIIAPAFGIVVVDEVHTVAAKTFREVVDRFPARWRIGVSADEKRKDRMEFLTYDVCGDVVLEIERDELEAIGWIHPVDVFVVPTDFRADWYAAGSREERDFTRLVEELVSDAPRNELLMRTIVRAVRGEELSPALVFTHRREHASTLADVTCFADGLRAGLLLGGKESEVRFNEDKARLLRRELDVAVGTFQSIGVGIDLPLVECGVVATPIGANKQFFNQVRGRLVRRARGKTRAVMFYLWDRHVFPDHVRNLRRWCGDDRVTVLDS